MKIAPQGFLAAALLLVAVSSLADAPAGRYAVANGTVTDSKTGLVWQQVDDGTPRDWATAKTYCTGLSLPGTGWRLPTSKELQTIVDDTRANPAIDPIFTNTGSTYYWSSSPVAPVSGSPSVAWLVYFYNGYTSQNFATDADRVRCVR